MATLESVLNRAGVSPGGVLDAQIDVPILCGPQRQGDVAWRPAPGAKAAATPIPAGGVQVVRSDASPNTHTLHNWDGPCFFDFRPNESVLGVLTVPEGSSAFLVHTEEHGANGIGPGTYEVTGQIEFAGVWRRVAD